MRTCAHFPSTSVLSVHAHVTCACLLFRRADLPDRTRGLGAVPLKGVWKSTRPARHCTCTQTAGRTSGSGRGCCTTPVSPRLVRCPSSSWRRRGRTSRPTPSSPLRLRPRAHAAPPMRTSTRLPRSSCAAAPTAPTPTNTPTPRSDGIRRAIDRSERAGIFISPSRSRVPIDDH